VRLVPRPLRPQDAEHLLRGLGGEVPGALHEAEEYPDDRFPGDVRYLALVQLLVELLALLDAHEVPDAELAGQNLPRLLRPLLLGHFRDPPGQVPEPLPPLRRRPLLLLRRLTLPHGVNPPPE